MISNRGSWPKPAGFIIRHEKRPRIDYVQPHLIAIGSFLMGHSVSGVLHSGPYCMSCIARKRVQCLVMYLAHQDSSTKSRRHGANGFTETGSVPTWTCRSGSSSGSLASLSN